MLSRALRLHDENESVLVEMVILLRPKNSFPSLAAIVSHLISLLTFDIGNRWRYSDVKQTLNSNKYNFKQNQIIKLAKNFDFLHTSSFTWMISQLRFGQNVFLGFLVALALKKISLFNDGMLMITTFLLVLYKVKEKTTHEEIWVIIYCFYIWMI